MTQQTELLDSSQGQGFGTRDMGSEDARMTDSLDRLQQAAAAFARRSQYIRFYTVSNTPLDRSAYLLLTHLHLHGPASMGQLASEFDVNPSTITRQIGALADRGHVVVSRGAGGSNSTSVAVTTPGVTALEAVRSSRIRIFEELLEDWEPEDVHDLADKLQRFVAVLANDSGAVRMASKDAGHRILGAKQT